MKICDDTKNLCMQFESVVTNSTLTFSNIAFLQINQEIAAILKLSEIGNVDWKKMLDDLSKVPGNFTVDNLKGDIDNLYKAGANLAGAGMSNVGNVLLQSSQFNELFQGKLGAAIDIVDNYSELWKTMDKSIGNTLLGMIGGKDNVAGLFSLANYNLTSWMTDYLDETAGNYYTQRWYIARRDQGREKLCDYKPPTDDNSILKGDHWYRINTKDGNFYPNSNQREAILQTRRTMQDGREQRCSRRTTRKTALSIASTTGWTVISSAARRKDRNRRHTPMRYRCIRAGTKQKKCMRPSSTPIRWT